MIRRAAALALATLLPGVAAACDIAGAALCDESYTFTYDHDLNPSTPEIPGVITNSRETYTCNAYVYDGDDAAVVFSPDTSQLVRIETTSGLWANDPDVMVTQGSCDGPCTRQGVNVGDEIIQFNATAGQQYFIQFDDFRAGDLGWEYELEFDIWCSLGTCDPATDIDADLTCSSTRTGSTDPAVGNEMKYYDCPASAFPPGSLALPDEDPNRHWDPLWQTNPEAVYAFTPQRTGAVTFRLTDLSNDQDLYVLADSCNPASCLAASTRRSNADDQVTFTAQAGRTYYLVVEGYAGSGSFTLDFPTGTGGCPEDCDNGVDDDEDGAADCLDSDCTGDPACACDGDRDGYLATRCGGDDCNDADPNVHPGATELCNGIDDDCDGPADEGLTIPEWWLDTDGDGYGSGSAVRRCTAPAGYVGQAGDCAPGNGAIFPGAREQCNGVDDDCDGTPDDGLTLPSWYLDGDGDTWGAGSAVVSCTAPPNHVGRAGDCADGDPTRYPGRPEQCNGVDDDCDGPADEGLQTFRWYADGDGDQYGTSAYVDACRAPAGHVAASGDCADNDPTRHPGAAELCDDIDQDCDGLADEGLPALTWYVDQDRDTWGGSTTVADCAAPPGTVGRGGDCRDDLPSIHPGATDGCDGVDNDCDGQFDEDGDAAIWYRDVDGDGFGGATTVNQCAAPAGYVGQGGDCADNDPARNPAAAEVCNAVDDDCDGLVDDADPGVDASGGTRYFRDADGDGAGDRSASARACARPVGYVADDRDCDDGNANRAPTLTERCDGVDNDCDLTVDEGTGCYDDDGDGFTEVGGDCDDASPSRAPGRPEQCDGVDQDCDGLVDEGTRCFDDDGDGATEDQGDCHDANAAIGPHVAEIEGNGIDDDCDGAVDGASYDPDGDGFTELGGDCVEGDALAYPGAEERPNGQDDDCDGLIDEDTAVSDDDGDGFSEAQGDCDDTDPARHPGADEPLNGVDDDCDGLVDDGGPAVDDDGDGLSEDEGDCDDGAATTHPGAAEHENGVDDDCDGLVDEDFVDVDRDGLSAAEGDCDDEDGWVRPGLVELCDGVDNDCNGTVDDGCDETGGPVPVDPGGCACDSGGSWLGGFGAGPLLALALAARRRRWWWVAAPALLAGCPSDTNVGALDARIGLTPAVADLGEVAVGGTYEVELTVLHMVGPAVTVRAIDVFNIDGDAFTGPEEMPVIERGGAARFVVTYTPEEEGWHRAAVTVLSNAALSPELEVQVRAHAVVPAGDVWPRVLEFGVVEPGAQPTRELSVYNDGELAFSVTGLTVDAPFAVLTALPLEIPPGEVGLVAVRAAPEDALPAQDLARLQTEPAVALPALTVRANACEGGAPWAYDVDQDGFTACGGDCDDADDEVHPGAPERANGADDDCDEAVDEGTAAHDDDGDGFSEVDGDCHDGDAAMAPDLPELPGNGLDDDCDGVVDTGSTDADGDGVSPGGGDCDDARADVRPGAPELPDGRDNDCDRVIDEGTVLFDDDGDGFCESANLPCTDGAANGDCDDTLPGTFPGAAERPNGRDDDCDGLVDEGTGRADDDGDGYTENGGDCDDTRPDVHPGAVEQPGNGRDDDCDPSTAD